MFAPLYELMFVKTVEPAPDCVYQCPCAADGVADHRGVGAIERQSAALFVTLPVPKAPIVPPLPICSVPLLIVVAP